MTDSIIGYEKVILGNILIDDSVLDGELAEEGFFIYHLSLRNHKLIYAAADEIHRKGDPVNILTVTSGLEESGKLDEAGGAAFIASLTDSALSGSLAFYIRKIKADFQKRMTRRFLAEAQDGLNDPSISAPEVLEKMNGKIAAVSDEKSRCVFTGADALKEVKETVDRLRADMDFPGIPSGFDFLDSRIIGFQNGEVTVLGARPSMGKTALGLTWFLNVVKRGVKAGFFSLEMSRETLTQRLLSCETGIPLHAIRRGLHSPEMYEKAFGAESTNRLAEYPMYIVDSPGMYIEELRATARNLVKCHDVKILFIDYIGLIRTREKGEVYMKQSIISQQLKQLARDLCVPLVVLCQVNRNGENAQPSLSDLRGSGSIEQDADLVIFILGERVGKDGKPAQKQLGVMKNRNGALFRYKIDFDAERTLFREFERNGKEEDS